MTRPPLTGQLPELVTNGTHHIATFTGPSGATVELRTPINDDVDDQAEHDLAYLLSLLADVYNKPEASQ